MVFSTAPRGGGVPLRTPLPNQLLRGDAALSNLDGESDNQLYFEDLLERGRELNRQGQRSLAMGVFDHLRLQENIPGEIRRTAQSEWEVERGTAPLGLRLERSLSGFLDQVTAPELLVGMGLAALGFSMGRIAGMQLARAGGWGPSSILWGGRLLGLATEAATFVGAGRLTAIGLGRSKAPFWNGFGEDWLHAIGMVGALRAARGAVQAFYGYGPSWLPSNRWQRWVYQSQQGLAELLTLGAVNSAYQYGAIGRVPHAEYLITETLAQWAAFHGAGRISRQLWGPYLGGVEQRLIRETKALEAELATSPFPSPIVLMAMAGEGPPGSKGRGTPPSRPRQRPGRAQETPSLGSMDIAGTALRPFAMRSTQHLIGFLKAPAIRLPLRLEAEHLYFEIPSPKELEVDSLLQFLNGLDNLARIPGGRLLCVRFQDGSPTADLLKLGPAFQIRYRKPSPQPPSSGPIRRASTPPEAQMAEMREVSRRMERIRSSHPPAAPKRLEVGPDKNQVPQVLENMRELSTIMVRLEQQGFRRANRPMVLLGYDITPDQLSQQTLGKISGFPQNLFLEIWAPQIRKTFEGRSNGSHSLHFTEVSRNLWEVMGQIPYIENHTVKTPLDVFLLIEALSRVGNSGTGTGHVIQYTGKTSVQDLQRFILETLNRYHLAGSQFHVRLKGETQAMVFFGHGGNWSTSGRARRLTLPYGARVSGPVAGANLRLIHSNADLLDLIRERPETHDLGSLPEFFLNFNRSVGSRELNVLSERLTPIEIGSTLLIHDRGSKATYAYERFSSAVKESKIFWEPPRNLDQLAPTHMVQLLQQLSFMGSRPHPFEVPLPVEMKGGWEPTRDGLVLQEYLTGQRYFPFQRVEVRFDRRVAGLRSPLATHIFLRDSGGIWSQRIAY